MCIRDRVDKAALVQIVDGVRRIHVHKVRAGAVADRLHGLAVDLAVRLLLGDELVLVLRGIEGGCELEELLFVLVGVGVPVDDLRLLGLCLLYTSVHFYDYMLFREEANRQITSNVESSLIIAISQSGETEAIINDVREAEMCIRDRAEGCRIL